MREVKFKEADKMLTVLTEDEGKLSVCAKGALRKGSKFAAATEFLTFSEVTLFGNKGRWQLNEAVTTEQFLGLREDLSYLALGSYFAEMLDSAADEDSPGVEILNLGLNSLFALSRKLYEPGHIKAVFEMRLMCLSGYEPFLEGCSVCGEKMSTELHFSADGGGLRCKTCLRETGERVLPICDASLNALRYIVYSEPKKVFSFFIEGEAKTRMHSLCEAYALAQSERMFDTLKYWKSVK
ncbi:MAG: DNA repair protein RecO [Oscillospiraceae bacterium]|nr:DNA repair protein RecO [Oscillospiraceae bacterium]